MQISHLGHVVLYVKNLKKSVEFYSELLGLDSYGTVFNGRAAVLTSGRTHHELLLIEVGQAPGPLKGHRLGLYHIGWCIGNTIGQLVEAKNQLDQAGVVIDGITDHTITKSIYIKDPDGNELELYVDCPEVDWKTDKSWIESPIKALNL
tara:strand:- start:32 stop:478 length:447 start_codon:yes stop_codon:yes gene_type:complete